MARGFDKYLNKRSIPKVIDPGADFTSTPTITVPEGVEQKISATSVTTFLEDMSLVGKRAASSINNTLSEIYTTNKTNGYFLDYYESAKRSFFDVRKTIKDPTASPDTSLSPKDFLDMEREVFQRSTDPKAPYVKTLFDSLQEVFLVDYLGSEIWGKLNKTRYAGELDDETAKYSIFQQTDYLAAQDNWAKTIGKLNRQGIPDCFIDGVGRLVGISSLEAGVFDALAESERLKRVIDNIKGIKIVLDLKKVDYNKEWERIRTNLDKSYTPILQELGRKVLYTSLFGIVSGISEKVFDALDEMDEIASLIGACRLQGEISWAIEEGVLESFGQIQEFISSETQRKKKIKESQERLLLYSLKMSSLQAGYAPFSAILGPLEALSLGLVNGDLGSKKGQREAANLSKQLSDLKTSFSKLTSF